MVIEVRHRPAYALAVVKLEAGETVVGEAGALVSRDTHVTMETSAGNPQQGLVAGLFTGLKRMFAGESFFQNRYTAGGRAGEVTFAPTLIGDVDTHELRGGTLLMQSTAYLCSPPSVEIDAKWGGARSFFAGEGFILIRAKGTGPVAFNAFGAMKLVEVDGEFLVDTGHVVAFEDTLKYTVRRFGDGWKAFIFGGEGLVCKFSGKGKLWIQTRNPVEFGKSIGPSLPTRES
ncbi:MAG: TIGR00266 family protein [Myxococcota bacterium]